MPKLSPESLARRRKNQAERHQRYLDAYLGQQRIRYRKDALAEAGPVIAVYEKWAAFFEDSGLPGAGEMAAHLRAEHQHILDRFAKDADALTEILREQILRYQGRFGGPLNGYLAARITDPALKARLQQEFDQRADAYFERANLEDSVQQHLDIAAVNARIERMRDGGAE